MRSSIIGICILLSYATYSQQNMGLKKVEVGGVYSVDAEIINKINSHLATLIDIPWSDDIETNKRQNIFFKLSGTVETDISGSHRLKLKCEKWDEAAGELAEVDSPNKPRCFTKNFAGIATLIWRDIDLEIKSLKFYNKYRTVVFVQKNVIASVQDVRSDLEREAVQITAALSTTLNECEKLNDLNYFALNNSDSRNKLVVHTADTGDSIKLSPKLTISGDTKWKNRKPIYKKSDQGPEEIMDKLINLICSQNGKP